MNSSQDKSLRQRKKESAENIISTQDEYTKIIKPQISQPQSSSSNLNQKICLILILLGFLVRLFRISMPSEVVFDEVHFGGFARKYINRDYFMDVHPPLGKLLFAGVAYIGGFDGVFKFAEIGKSYIGVNVPYVAMRLLSGIFGILLVPTSYLTLKNYGISTTAAISAASFILFENALACQSRLILLDASLIFFISFTALAWSSFLTVQKSPFSINWWSSLILTGVGLGLSVSVKFVGLFIFAIIGIETLRNLWDLLGDMTLTKTQMVKHFSARAFCLLAIPITIYLSTYYAHFNILVNKGTGSTSMSPEFQYSLIGNTIPSTFTDVGFHSRVYIRHESTTGGYLHSHAHFYETGSKQQQITCYPHRDINNYFNILPALEVVNGTYHAITFDKFVKIKHGDIIRLEHASTGKMLHSHDHRMPMSDDKESNEVSAYGGTPGFIGDSNDHWRVEVVDRTPGKPYLHSIVSKFRLVHQNTGKALFSHSVKLPAYAFGQQEVGAGQRAKKHLTHWRIESNEHDLLPESSPKTSYGKIGFWRKVYELHSVMFSANAGLTNHHPYDSRPGSWPLFKRGIAFWTASKAGSSQIYLVGNIVVWYIAFVSITAYPIYLAITLLLGQRQIRSPLLKSLEPVTKGMTFFFSAWLMHYLPFFFMERQLFIHHYLPALYFSILCSAVIFDMLTIRTNKILKIVITVVLVVAAVKVFLEYAPLTFGGELSREHCESLKIKDKWDFSCNHAGRSDSVKTTQVTGDDAE